MSYDIYCYKSALGRPDLDEARIAIEEIEGNEYDVNYLNSEIKEKIAKALVDLNPKLERFNFDYEEIAKLQKISIDEAKQQFQHIELNKPDDELAVQLTIFDNNVSIIVPFWYVGDKAKAVFQEVSEYTRVIRKTAGYFVYDPQIETAYDPLIDEFSGLSIYEDTTSNLKENLSSTQTKKPWWKFW